MTECELFVYSCIHHAQMVTFNCVQLHLNASFWYCWTIYSFTSSYTIFSELTLLLCSLFDRVHSFKLFEGVCVGSLIQKHYVKKRNCQYQCLLADPMQETTCSLHVCVFCKLIYTPYLTDFSFIYFLIDPLIRSYINSNSIA